MSSPFGSNGPGEYGQPPASSGKALAALVLGIAGIFAVPLIASVLAVYFGKQAQREIGASGGQVGGSGLAKAGIILGWVGIALVALAAAAILVVVLGLFAAS